MRNALAIYLYHLPADDQERFLELLFPVVPAAQRERYLTEIVTPIPPFYDKRVERALAVLRPRTANDAYNILNAADVAVRIKRTDERDQFVRSVCDSRVGQSQSSRALFADGPLFDSHRSSLRHISNEDPRVVRAIGKLTSNPYGRITWYTHRRVWKSSSAYLAELGRQQTDEDAALIEAMRAGTMPRVFRDEDPEQLQLHYLLCTGHWVNEAFDLMERDKVRVAPGAYGRVRQRHREQTWRRRLNARGSTTTCACSTTNVAHSKRSSPRRPRSSRRSNRNRLRSRAHRGTRSCTEPEAARVQRTSTRRGTPPRRLHGRSPCGELEKEEVMGAFTNRYDASVETTAVVRTPAQRDASAVLARYEPPTRCRKSRSKREKSRTPTTSR